VHAQLRTISLIDTTPAMYLAARADFGDFMLDPVVVNLMFPPLEHADLCSLPEVYNFTNKTINPDMLPTDSVTPIALLVRRDSCSPQTKAHVALEIQKAFNPHVFIRYIIVYSGDATDDDILYRLQPDRHDGNPDDWLDLQDMQINLGILYIPFRYATSIGFRMRTQAAVTGTSEILYNENNADWGLYAEIEPYDAQPDSNGGYNYGGHGGFQPPEASKYYWLRFTLFTLLIVSPCLRAGYLWYAGGGRLHWRRNEEGRIVGIQYIP
jgi:hypothetical protein